jgi:uncharacterized membrane protein
MSFFKKMSEKNIYYLKVFFAFIALLFFCYLAMRNQNAIIEDEMRRGVRCFSNCQSRKLYWISFVSPYIVAAVSYIFLLVLKEKVKLFSKTLWSPFVMSFGVIFILVLTVLFYQKYGEILILKVFSSSWSNIDNIFGIPKRMLELLFLALWLGLNFHQFLWLSLTFQILAIKKQKKSYLAVAAIFTWISTLFPIYAEFFVGKFS